MKFQGARNFGRSRRGMHLWDLLVDIQHALRELPGIDLTYVKGHQDDKKAYDRLPLMARLNVDADRLAGKYNKEHGAWRPFAFLLR
jgi:hypothetical protein